ncbi:hypothetical protein U1708_08020 [Sphingomonas sp. ZB1N12]|uniref:hypothetical protein n=1 Tax=Sphingomonas arabinosi TaxID=3096160 RepID=UPI002FCC95A6
MIADGDPPMIRRLEDVEGGADVLGNATSLRIADFLLRTEAERLTLLRTYLRATVKLTSPLLLELALLEGISLTRTVERIRPPENWPWRPMDDHLPSVIRSFQRPKAWLQTPYKGEVQRFARSFASPGVVVRDADDPRGRFGVRPYGSVLGFCASVGPCMLSVFGRSAIMKLPEPLPDTLTAAMPGRPVGAIFDHPMFAARDYTIRRVMPDLADGSPVLMIRVPLVPFEMPWSEDGL